MITIQIREVQHNPYPLQISKDATVEELKQAIYQHDNNFPADRIRLCVRGANYSGRILTNELTLPDIRVKENDTVYMVIGIQHLPSNDPPQEADSTNQKSGMMGNPMGSMMGWLLGNPAGVGLGQTGGPMGAPAASGLGNFEGLGGIDGLLGNFTGLGVRNPESGGVPGPGFEEQKVVPSPEELQARAELERRLFPQTAEYQQQMQELTDQGFLDIYRNYTALKASDGDLPNAIKWLKEHPRP